ncbi:hypothetical protein BV22DRAFT_1134682 [Leucogyrophana mollusca]|uniref:Uncharacterized protein n=1 Tax=Leucogyrophana mollusca TaxID=85980 RepID=A0ACB8AY48_9AGAM|nr:hypothetical protein BV22DRAFT_1134682 [Leucogyrophana mollusca]
MNLGFKSRSSPTYSRFRLAGTIRTIPPSTPASRLRKTALPTILYSPLAICLSSISAFDTFRIATRRSRFVHLSALRRPGREGLAPSTSTPNSSTLAFAAQRSLCPLTIGGISSRNDLRPRREMDKPYRGIDESLPYDQADLESADTLVILVFNVQFVTPSSSTPRNPAILLL